MEESLFKNYVDQYFEPLVLELADRATPEQYMFKQMLTPEYTPTLTWTSLSGEGRNVVADVVSMDSSLPLKRRQKIESANGKVPKIGMKKYLGEAELTTLDILQRQNVGGRLDREIRRKLFNDTNACMQGVYEQAEAMFLEGLSTGVTVVNDPLNEGLSIRLDYGYPAANTSNATALWSTGGATAKPLTDISNIRAEARKNGDNPRYMLMSQAAYDNFVSSDEVKELYAASIGFTGTNAPMPNFEQANRALRGQHSLEIIIVDRSVTYEKNGVRTSVLPFDAENIILLNSLQVGSFVWGTLAEMNHPSKAVDYVVADNYILLSKYHEVDPLREFTSSQALAVPVINNVNSIYMIKSETV